MLTTLGRRILLGVVYVAIGLLLAACVMTPQGFVPLEFVRATGENEMQELDLGQFDRVMIGSAFRATVQQGDAFRVAIEADTALMPHVQAQVNAGRLRIELAPGVSTMGNATLRADITLPVLRELAAGGATEVEVAGFAGDDALEFAISGASQVDAQVDAGDVEIGVSGASRLTLEGVVGNVVVDASGASRVTLEGSGENSRIHASGASRVDMADFPVTDGDVNASGASSVTIHATGQLDGDASGASSIRYLGSPTLGDLRTSGGSNVGPR